MKNPLFKRGDFYNTCDKSKLKKTTGMNDGYDIKSITKKFIEGNCTPDELEAAMILFADPYHHNPELQAALKEYWNNPAADSQKEIHDEDFSPILDKVHHRINLVHNQKPKGRIKKLILTASKIAANTLKKPNRFILHPLHQRGRFLRWFYPIIPSFTSMQVLS
jgi:hypothetical protein